MGTKIGWTNETWSPIVGCSKVSPGCKNCYAEKMAARLAGIEYANSTETDTGLPPLYMRGHKYISVTDVYHATETKNKRLWNGKTYFDEKALDKPLRWKKPRMIFVCSMGDLFHESVPFEWIDKVMAIVALCPQHTFQVLTKRADRMLEYFTAKNRTCPPSAMEQYSKWTTEECIGVEADVAPSMKWPLPNLWLGVTAENQEQADKRIPILLQIPAAVRFVSVEPMLEYVNLNLCLNCQLDPSQCHEHNKLDWIIVGCESGHNRRSVKVDYIRMLAKECELAGVPFFMKQIEIDGKVCKDVTQFPKELQVREFPNV